MRRHYSAASERQRDLVKVDAVKMPVDATAKTACP